MSLRSPLGRVLGSGSAKEGAGHWWAQRVTAVGLVMLGGWFLLAMMQIPGFDYVSVRAWIARPANSVLLLLMCVTLAYHSVLGVQVVIEDYVHGPLKIAALVFSKFAHIAATAVAVFAVLKIAFGVA